MASCASWLMPDLSLIHISEPTRLLSISYAVFCLKKKKKHDVALDLQRSEESMISLLPVADIDLLLSLLDDLRSELGHVVRRIKYDFEHGDAVRLGEIELRFIE